MRWYWHDSVDFRSHPFHKFFIFCIWHNIILFYSKIINCVDNNIGIQPHISYIARISNLTPFLRVLYNGYFCTWSQTTLSPKRNIYQVFLIPPYMPSRIFCPSISQTQVQRPGILQIYSFLILSMKKLSSLPYSCDTSI